MSEGFQKLAEVSGFLTEDFEKMTEVLGKLTEPFFTPLKSQEITKNLASFNRLVLNEVILMIEVEGAQRPAGGRDR
ncbi:hypothetical protein ACQCU1_08685 [Sutcliffiella horikoshii]|uniref:hypothetical protein n=1 Tax=Sutcliffiella horikoshii TaxID=79883 RepID=UPI003CF3D43D